MEDQQAFFDEQEAHATKRHRGLGYYSDGSAQQLVASDTDLAGKATETPDSTSEIEAAKERTTELAEKLEGNTATTGVKRPREWEATVSEKIYLPVGEDPDFDWVGLILGPNGKTQEEIESETRCHIDLHGKGAPEAEEASAEPLHVVVGACDQDDLDSGCRRIRGLISQDRKAQEAVAELAAANTSGAADAGADPATATTQIPASIVPINKTVHIPNAKVGMIIGRGGETIQSLQHRSGAHIQVEKDGAFNRGDEMRPVHITGTQEQVDVAEKLITDTVSQPSFREAEGIEEDSLLVSNSKIGLVIGRGGETIRNLQERTKTRIQVQPDQRDGSDRKVTVAGHKESVAMARKLIEDIVSAPPGTNHGYHSQHGGYRPPAHHDPYHDPYYQQYYGQYYGHYGQYYPQPYAQPYYGHPPYYGQQPGYDYSQYYQQYQAYYGQPPPEAAGAPAAAAAPATSTATVAAAPTAAATPAAAPAAEGSAPAAGEAASIEAAPAE
eukprot:CAMPEP_0118928658 /NCGR_PEP_ID=MMETSP1169-20130426/5863_1 /TAXON_ID=36882 /ORGANISM="Pyramimonas obovata, Strain CCMP722" /LENGTH=497 /DNA_ID=CAMNT_0006870687 /DNA_START=166 /DNA_END=1659 /DNA_ORIENTATION=-